MRGPAADAGSPAVASDVKLPRSRPTAMATKRDLVGRYGASRRRVGTLFDAGGSPSSPVPEEGPVGVAGGDRGDENFMDAARAALLLAGEEEQRPLSEDGAVGLVRLVGWRRSPRCAGSIGASNVACRGRTPDLTTAIQAVAKSGVEAGRTGAVTRITDLPFWGGCSAGCRSPKAAPRVSDSRAALRASVRQLPALPPRSRSRGEARA